MLDRNSKQCLLGELEMAGAKVKHDGKEIVCPFHEDRHPSGGIYQDADGVWRYKCHAASCGFCGDVFDVIARVRNCPVGDVLKTEGPQAQSSKAPNRPKAPQVHATIEAIESIVPGKLEARYTYTNPQTQKPDLVVLRFVQGGKKQFWQVSPVSEGWILQRPPGLLPLYNRIAIAKADTVIVVEGEKCVHALRGANHVATTSPMGAGKAQYADWTPLAGKTLYLWPDFDEGGIKHMRDVSAIVDKMEPAPKVFWLDPGGLHLPPKGDVVDFLDGISLELYHTAILSVLENAEPMGAAKELYTVLEDTIAGRRVAVRWPWDVLANLTKALLPGTVTLICGEPDSGKSFFVLQALDFWHTQGVKVALYELEEDRPYHLNRMLAQRAGKADFFDPDWIMAHPEEVRSVFQQHADYLDGAGRCIYAAPDKQLDYGCLIQWVQARASEKCRIIVLDPLSAVAPERETWIADSQFMFAIKAIAREYGTSIVLVTHPRKGHKSVIGLDELAGGAAFQRFSQTVIWLQHHKELKDVRVSSPVGRFDCEINKTAHLIKTRNGKGHGLGIAFRFDGQSLRFAEQGLILPQGKESGE